MMPQRGIIWAKVPSGDLFQIIRDEAKILLVPYNALDRLACRRRKGNSLSGELVSRCTSFSSHPARVGFWRGLAAQLPSSFLDARDRDREEIWQNLAGWLLDDPALPLAEFGDRTQRRISGAKPGPVGGPVTSR
jgi:hypothetical protein